MNNTAITIVTAYYEVPSKRTKAEYYKWINNFFQLNCNIVLFTDAAHSADMQFLRRGKPMHIIIREFCDLEMWKKYFIEWHMHYSMDPEQKIHSPDLYAIWANKSLFVEEAYSIDPFNTEYFMWCDIGAFRDSSHISMLQNAFPLRGKNAYALLNENKVIFSTMAKYNKRIPVNMNNSLVGGLFIGNKVAHEKWRFAYLSMLEDYIKKGIFAGKDQTIMMHVLLNDKKQEFATVITGPQKTQFIYNKWFFLEYYLAGILDYKLDNSFITT